MTRVYLTAPVQSAQTLIFLGGLIGEGPNTFACRLAKENEPTIETHRALSGEPNRPEFAAVLAAPTPEERMVALAGLLGDGEDMQASLPDGVDEEVLGAALASVERFESWADMLSGRRTDGIMRGYTLVKVAAGEA